MSVFNLILIAVGLVVVNAFFVAVEFALMASNRERIEELAETGAFGASAVLRAFGSINVQLAASQLGISIVSLVLGWLIEPVISEGMIGLLGDTSFPDGVVRWLGLAIGLGLAAFVHMVLGEMVPRSVAFSAPETTARRLVPIHLGFVSLARPAVRILHWMGRIGTRIFGVEPVDELSSSHTASELAVMVDEAHASGEIEPTEHDLLVGAFSFLAITVSDVMTPVGQLVTIPHTSTVAGAEQIMFGSGHSRVLVMGSSPDQVVGFLHAKDLISLDPSMADSLLPPELVRVALRVAPTDRVEDLLPKMRRARRHVAVVLDGSRLVGLVTLEDVLEAIVGDIRDETDREATDDGNRSALPTARWRS